MSRDEFMEFLKKLDGSAEMRADLHERFGDQDGVPAGDLIAFAGDHGYEFSVVESDGELSDAALEGVAGGAFNYYKISTELRSLSFEEIKVTYQPSTQKFNFEKIEY